MRASSPKPGRSRACSRSHAADLGQRRVDGPELAGDDLVERQLPPEPGLVLGVGALVAELEQHEVETVHLA